MIFGFFKMISCSIYLLNFQLSLIYPISHGATLAKSSSKPSKVQKRTVLKVEGVKKTGFVD